MKETPQRRVHVGEQPSERLRCGARLESARVPRWWQLTDAALEEGVELRIEGRGPVRWMQALQGTSTTIGVVATDATLSNTEANKLTSLARHGLSRAIDPITVNDGDARFALTTGTSGRHGDLSALGCLPPRRWRARFAARCAWPDDQGPGVSAGSGDQLVSSKPSASAAARSSRDS